MLVVADPVFDPADSRAVAAAGIGEIRELRTEVQDAACLQRCSVLGPRRFLQADKARIGLKQRL